MHTTVPSSFQLSNRYHYLFPSTKQALRSCLGRNQCQTFRPGEHLHDYYRSDWFFTASKLLDVKCLHSDTQEPYVVVKRHPELPLFNESFVNYAYNKVQWLEHLRYVGYRYAILVDGYSVDIPHPPLAKRNEVTNRSAFRQRFFKQLKETRVFPMFDTYYDFLRVLNQTVEKKEVLHLCSNAYLNPRKVYYSSKKSKK